MCVLSLALASLATPQEGSVLPFTRFASAPARAAYAPTPAVAYAPAPVAYAPAAQAYAPAPVVQYQPAPQVVYTPAPVAPAAPYVDPYGPYPDEEAFYTYQYSVLDDYSSSNFGVEEARSGPQAQGKYYVALPDGRLQTVTWTVDGHLGYVADVEYSGEAAYPPAPAGGYAGEV